MLNLLERTIIVFLCNVPIGATGFGDAIVLYCILSFWFTASSGTAELNEVILLLTVGGIGSLGLQARNLWDKINWTLVFWLVIPTVLFCMAGMSVLQLLHDYALLLKRILGLLFLFVAMYKVNVEVKNSVALKEELASGVKRNKAELVGPLETSSSRMWTLIAASSSGMLAGIYGTPGPPLMAWVSFYKIPKDEWMATNAVVWFVANIFRLAHIAFIEATFEPKDLMFLGCFLLLVGGVGSAVGAEASKRIGEYSFRLFIIVLLIFGANTMLFAGQPKSEAIVGIATTFLGVLAYSFYMLFIDKLPSYPVAHLSGAEQSILSLMEYLGLVSTSGKRNTANRDFENVKYSEVSSADDDDEDEYPNQTAKV